MQISVVVASYNHASYICDCIRSALGQTLRPAEVIVIDDGSTDGSRDVLEAFGPEITPVFQANRGTYATLNTGIERARCDWVAIHNSDDLWQPSKLEAQSAVAQADARVGLIHTGVEYMDATGSALIDVPGADLRLFSAPKSYHGLPVMLRQNPVVISSVLLSKRAWEQAGRFDDRYLGMGDWEFCVRAAQVTRFGFAGGPLTRVRKHAQSAGMDATRLPSDWDRRDWFRLLDDSMPRAAEKLFEEARRGEVERAEATVALASLATLQTRDGRTREARRALRLAARLSPLRLKTYLRYVNTLKSR